MDDSHDDVTELAFNDYASVLSLDGFVFGSIEEFYFISTTSRDTKWSWLPDYDLTNEWIGYPFEHTIKVEDLESNIELPNIDQDKVL